MTTIAKASIQSEKWFSIRLCDSIDFKNKKRKVEHSYRSFKTGYVRKNCTSEYGFSKGERFFDIDNIQEFRGNTSMEYEACFKVYAKYIRRCGRPVKYIHFNFYYETTFHNHKSHAPDALYVILHVCNVCNALEY